MQKSYKPHKYQLEFHRSTARYRALIAGRRSGKSIAGTIEALYWVDQMPKKLGASTSGIIVAPTYQDLNDVNVRMIEDWVPASSIKEFNKSEMRMTFINGSEIVFRYADPQRIGRGRKYHWAWLDEAALYNQGQLVWETLRPSLTDYKGSAWITTTPQGKDWVYKTFYLPAMNGDSNYQVWHYKTIDNPYIDPDEVEVARGSMTDIMFRQEYLASFESFSGLVYPDFDRKTHIIDTWERTADMLFFVGIDVGWEHPTGILLMAEDKEHTLYIVDEVQKQYLTAPQIEEEIDIMLSRNGLKRQDIQDFVIDPASKGTDQTSGVSIFDQLQDPTVVKEPIPLVEGVNDVMAGINRVTQLIRTNRILTVKRCTNMIGQWESYKWAVHKNEAHRPEVYKVGDDLVDPARYIVTSRPDWSERIEYNAYNEPILQRNEIWMPDDGIDMEGYGDEGITL